MRSMDPNEMPIDVLALQIGDLAELALREVVEQFQDRAESEEFRALTALLSSIERTSLLIILAVDHQDVHCTQRLSQ